MTSGCLQKAKRTRCRPATGSSKNTWLGIATTPARSGSARQNDIPSSQPSAETSAVAKYVPSGTRTSSPTLVNPPQSRSRRSCSSAASSRGKSGVSSRACATAGCSGEPDVNVSHCFAASTAPTSSAGPVAQPTFHPVNEYDFPALDRVSVRSNIPGRVASGTCSWSSKVRCS